MLWRRKYLKPGNLSADEARAAYVDAREEEVRPKMIAAYVLYGVGGAALVAGIITWIARPDRSDTMKPTSDIQNRLTVSPMMVPSGAGALVGFEW